MADLFRNTAVLGLATSYFMTGFAFSASNITLPSLYALPAASSMKVAETLYKKGGLVALPAGLIAALAFSNAAYRAPETSASSDLISQKRTLYIAAAVFSLFNGAFTRIFMQPAIDRIIQIASSPALQASVARAETSDVLWKWHWMNYVRSAASLTAGLLGTYAYTLSK